MALPELDRISKFGTSVDAVTERTPRPPGSPGTEGSGSGSGKSSGGSAKPERPRFDNDLGNLFGQVNPARCSGSGRAATSASIPATGPFRRRSSARCAARAVALALGAVAAWRQAETAILAALAAAAAIWLAARVGSTPYTNAKALQMLAPLVMLVAARGVLDPLAPLPLRGRRPGAIAILAAAFVAAAAASSALALANAPVGPDDYTPGVRKLANRFAGQPTLLLAPADVVAGRHGAEFYGWELREGVIGGGRVLPGAGSAPAGITRVLVVGGDQSAPFDDVRRIGSANRVVLWRVLDSSPLELAAGATGADAAAAIGPGSRATRWRSEVDGELRDLSASCPTGRRSRSSPRARGGGGGAVADPPRRRPRDGDRGGRALAGHRGLDRPADRERLLLRLRVPRRRPVSEADLERIEEVMRRAHRRRRAVRAQRRWRSPRRSSASGPRTSPTRSS